MNCPKCDEPIVMAALQNQRNGKWTALPLDLTPTVVTYEDKFNVSDEEHEAFGILGDSLGMLPIATLDVTGPYTPHSPSHFLEP